MTAGSFFGFWWFCLLIYVVNANNNNTQPISQHFKLEKRAKLRRNVTISTGAAKRDAKLYHNATAVLKRSTKFRHNTTKLIIAAKQNTNIRHNVTKLAAAAKLGCPGVVILGMHRSGTSLLTGLINQLGLHAGGHLLPATSDNSKGYFENFDVYKQNVRWLAWQNASYNYNTFDFNCSKAHIESHHGKSAVATFNNQTLIPWMLKDPRLCITLPVWLRYFKAKPAVIFTYRHPVEVLHSFQSRNNHTWAKPNRIFRMWYVYNRRAIESSEGLCRIVTSNKRILHKPVEELQLIFEALQERCKLPKLKSLNASEILSFVDAQLQHHSADNRLDVCTLSHRSFQVMKDAQMLLLDLKKSENYDLKLYEEVMRLYCAMEENSLFNSTVKFTFDDSIHDRLLEDKA